MAGIYTISSNRKYSIYYQTKIICVSAIIFFINGISAVSPNHNAPTNSIAPPLEEPRICAYYASQEVRQDTTSTAGESKPTLEQLSEDGTQVRCNNSNEYCFAFWQQNDTHTKVQLKGCFPKAANCASNTCVSQPLNNGNITNHFCCCAESLCNVNVSVGSPAPSKVSDNAPDEEVDTWNLTVVLGISAICLLSLVIVLILVFQLCNKRFRKNERMASSMPNLPIKDSPSSPVIDLNAIKYVETIGSGKFGTAYRATINDEEVAVKLFSLHNRMSFMNEKYIYSLPLMSHPYLLSYLGGGEMIGPDGHSYYGLVLSYCPKGRLSSYLQANTISWNTFCHIAVTATRGLAHLHSDLRRSDLVKPAVCHRDFNTRNLLLNSDMSCVVADLGFAIHVQGSKYYSNGEEMLAETSSLTDVGTLRYMAPEVLEGAVNLRDCEASLKQIDIYALGLVLWEIAARCHDLYQGLRTPDYALPFQAEIGDEHASFEQMQVLVARKKARPLFPNVWKDTNPAMKQLKETIEDCWDHDAEARLSAMCVEGRLTDLPLLWERHRSSLGMNGISPTMNGTGSSMLSRAAENGGLLISNVLNTPKEKPTHSSSETNQQETSVSSATVETIVTMSPTDTQSPAQEILCKNELVENLQPPLLPIQPHQGHNPCLERNLIREIKDEPSVMGNTLIDPNDNNSHIGPMNTANIMEALESHSSLDSRLLVNEHLLPLLKGYPIPSMQPTQNMNVMNTNQTGVMSHPISNPPIPYLQNEVHAVEARPKKQNMPVEQKNGGWRKWKSAVGNKINSILPRHRHNIYDEERQEILVTPTESNRSEPSTPPGYNPNSNTGLTPPPSNLDIIPNQVTFQSTDLANQSEVICPSELNIEDENLIVETELGLTKINYLAEGERDALGFVDDGSSSKQGSKDSGLNKSSDSNLSYADNDSLGERTRRPDTLSLCNRVRNHNISHKTFDSSKIVMAPKISLPNISISNRKQDPDSEEEGPTIKLRKPKTRVKTPRRPTNTRLSLYNDRIMGSSITSTNNRSNKNNFDKTNPNLSHSLPGDIESLDTCVKNVKSVGSENSKLYDSSYCSLNKNSNSVVLKQDQDSNESNQSFYLSLPRIGNYPSPV